MRNLSNHLICAVLAAIAMAGQNAPIRLEQAGRELLAAQRDFGGAHPNLERDLLTAPPQDLRRQIDERVEFATRMTNALGDYYRQAATIAAGQSASLRTGPAESLPSHAALSRANSAFVSARLEFLQRQIRAMKDRPAAAPWVDYLVREETMVAALRQSQSRFQAEAQSEMEPGRPAPRAKLTPLARHQDQHEDQFSRLAQHAAGALTKYRAYCEELKRLIAQRPDNSVDALAKQQEEFMRDFVALPAKLAQLGACASGQIDDAVRELHQKRTNLLSAHETKLQHDMSLANANANDLELKLAELQRQMAEQRSMIDYARRDLAAAEKSESLLSPQAQEPRRALQALLESHRTEIATGLNTVTALREGKESKESYRFQWQAAARRYQSLMNTRKSLDIRYRWTIDDLQDRRKLDCKPN